MFTLRFHLLSSPGFNSSLSNFQSIAQFSSQFLLNTTILHANNNKNCYAFCFTEITICFYTNLQRDVYTKIYTFLWTRALPFLFFKKKMFNSVLLFIKLTSVHGLFFVQANTKIQYILNIQISSFFSVFSRRIFIFICINCINFVLFLRISHNNIRSYNFTNGIQHTLDK